MLVRGSCFHSSALNVKSVDAWGAFCFCNVDLLHARDLELRGATKKCSKEPEIVLNIVITVILPLSASIRKLAFTRLATKKTMIIDIHNLKQNKQS